MVNRSHCTAIIFITSLIAATTLVAQCPDMNLSPPVTLLVIDKSGSMNDAAGTWNAGPVDASRTPWQAVRYRIDGLLDRLADGSVVRAGLFSDECVWSKPLALDAAARDSLRRAIDANAPVENYGRTSLFDSLLDALDQARSFSVKDPTRDIAIIVYTDGKDSTENDTERDAKLNDIRTRFPELVKENENIWLYYTPIVQGQAIKTIIDHPHAVEVGFRFPIPLQLDRSSFVLGNAKANPETEVAPFLCGSDGIWPLIQGKELKFEFVPDQGQVIRIEADSVRITKGQIQIPLHIVNASDLKAAQAYSGNLKIIYPDLKDYEVRAPTQLRLRFQAAEVPEIYSVRPNDGSTVPRGAPVTFVVQTLQDASVLWDFGDDQSKSGSEVQHTFNTAGDRTVTVTVRSTNGLSAEATIRLSVIDLAANIVPVNSVVMENLAVELKRTIRGPIKRVEWMVDGHKHDPTDESNGSLTYTFDRSGIHTLQLLGYADAAEVVGDPMEINVVPGPRIEVASETFRPGQPVKFTLTSPPSVTSVDWRFDESDLIENGGTELSHLFEIRGTHSVVATVHFKETDSVAIQRDIAIVGEAPMAKISLGNEDDGEQAGARKHSLGETLPLVNSGGGDIRQQNWSVKRPGETDYSPLAPDTTTLPLNDLGPWSVRLETIGWPDLEGNVQTATDSVDIIVNPRPNRALFALLAAILAVLWILLGYLLVIGNSPRHWRLHHQFGSIPDPNRLVPFKLNRKGVWSWRHKRARVPLHRFTSKGYWAEDGRQEFVEISKIRGAEGPVAIVGYSGQSTSGVRLGRVISIAEDSTTCQVKVEESRMPEDRQSLYLLLEKKLGSELVPWLLFLFCTGILIAIVSALYRSIFGL